MGDKQELELISCLRANRDVFAWMPADMPGVPNELIEHALNVDTKPHQISNGYDISPRTSERPSRRS